MGMLAAVNAPSGGGDIDDVIHMSSKDEDHFDEDDSILAAVEKATTRKRGTHTVERMGFLHVVVRR